MTFGRRPRLLFDGIMLPTRSKRSSPFFGVICVTTHSACCGDCAEGAAGDAADVAEGGARDGPDSPRDAGPATDSPDDAGDAETDAPAPLDCEGSPECERVVFVTSLTYTGNLGGLAGADAKCQALADASPLPRVKGRTFLAWVSTTATSPDARFTHGIKPYIASNEELIASSWSDLTDGSLTSGIERDESGIKRSEGAWTGTKSGGATYSGAACGNWTIASFAAGGERGNVGGSGGGWSSGQTDPCALQNHLYCFEK
jgi:hypothetical protein